MITKNKDQYANLSDKELVDLILDQENEEAAVYLICCRYAEDIKFLCGRYLHTYEYLDDVTNELFVLFKGEHGDWAPLRGFQWKAKFRSWYSSVASHFLLKKRKQLIDFPGGAGSIHIEDNPEKEILPPDRSENMNLVFLMEAINRLREDYRFVLIKELEGYKATEIGNMLEKKKRAEGRIRVRETGEEIIPNADYVRMIRHRALKEASNLVKQINRE